MKEFIKEKLVAVYRDSTSDEWGQIDRADFSTSIFGEREDEVLEYIKTNPVIRVSTYSRAGRCVSEVVDEEIKEACKIARSENEHIKRNLRRW